MNLSALGKNICCRSLEAVVTSPLAVPPVEEVVGLHGTWNITEGPLDECAPPCPFYSFFVGEPRGGSSHTAANSSVWCVGRADPVLLSHHSVPARGDGAWADSWPFLPFLTVLRTAQPLSHGHKAGELWVYGHEASVIDLSPAFP